MDVHTLEQSHNHVCVHDVGPYLGRVEHGKALVDI